MELIHKDNGQKGSFVLKNDNSNAGEITYVWVNDNEIIIDHTGVRGEYEGKGLGKQLVDAVVGFARNNNVKITPLCPFAKLLFERNPVYNDVNARFNPL
jgi:predicted GNAT family acetyltransferase